MTLPYGDGLDKVFGMENFGNTCYCNSILQCLYYSEKFRIKLLSHHKTNHERKTYLSGIKPHTFTGKYETLVQKRTKEQQKLQDDKKTRKGLIFGRKFSNNLTNTANGSYPDNEIPNKKTFIFELNNCPYLSDEQINLIQKYNNENFKKIPVMVTRPSQKNDEDIGNKNDYSQSSSMLLGENSNEVLVVKDDGCVSSQSSFILIGIPYPETFLQSPINPFNPSPTSDQRKRLALINGPIINLDHSLQLPSEQSDDLALLYALKDMFECMVENKSNIGVVSPNFFISKLKEKNYLFRQNNMHHDAHEFCNYLINEIIECLNKENGMDNNWCTDLFQGIITNQTKCLNCETVTSKEETFLDLSIDIPPNSHSNSLTHLLNNFSKLEVLTHQNKFYCNSCSSLQEAVKTIKIKDLPEILVVNFKRFKYDERVDRLIKLFDQISYPLKLRLFNTTSNKDNLNVENNFQLYELSSLVVHIGGGPMHGHYISLCKIKPQIWMLFDDETVEIVDEYFVMKFFGNGPGLASAYILFYEKCDYLEEGEEEKMDFGFDVNDLFNGNEYNMEFDTSFDEEDNTTLDSSTKKTSISSKIMEMPKPIEVAEEEETPKKSPIFNKNFKLDSNTPSTSSFNSSAPTTGTNPVDRTRTLSNASGPLAPPEELKEKKSWVNGIRRRELKVERKNSVSLVQLEGEEKKEKKKLIFLFGKRK